MIKSTVKYAIIKGMNLGNTINIFIPKEIKFYVKALTFLFIASVVFGFIIAQQSPNEALEAIKETKGKLSLLNNLNQLQLFFVIFLNNALKAFLVMIFGVIFGIIPVLFIMLNGYIVGVVISVVLAQDGITTILLGILPHGLFEIFAMLITAGYGVWLGEVFSKKLRKKTIFMPYFKTALKNYIKVILPIIAFAGLIEAFITSNILKTFLM